MSVYTDIAKEFKARNNPSIDEPVIGTVISSSPLSISIYNGAITLNKDIIYVCENLVSIKGTISISSFSDSNGDSHAVNNTFEIKRTLNVGDKVMCIPTDHGQKYFIVEKVI